MTDVNDFKWKPIEGQIMTQWAEDVNPNNPLPEYPRPQLRRQEWKNLNGLWNYAILPKEKKTVNSYDTKILVPFPIESALSGVGKKLSANQRLWYQRYFKVPSSWNGKKILLHFGAVDWETEVWINNKKVGTHSGGYTSFYFDISEYISFKKENEVVVGVWDPTNKGTQERGKQSLSPKRIYYTAVSGIWQTVWLEPVAITFIKRIQMISDIDAETLDLSLLVEGIQPNDLIYIEIKEKDKIIVAQKHQFSPEIKIKIPSPKLWNPFLPFLYDLIIKIERENEIIDEINSYFGMREIELSIIKDGFRKISLNNELIFQYGTLDQGYWPDGLYTAPTDDALRYDIEITKELGFNMIRKHIKVEPARWYYYCDKIGILVWQDMPSGGDEILDPTKPIENLKQKDRDEQEKNQFYNELEAMIKQIFNSPSVIVWVPFNEGWGQFDTESVVKKIKEFDRTRLVDNASGWFDHGVGDICDHHYYPWPKMPEITKIGDRAAVIGEFGGLGLEVKSHMWKRSSKFVYRNYDDPNRMLKKYGQLISTLRKLIKEGLVAAIYTQITDVEGEVNGLLTYDRKVIKMNENQLKELNFSLYQAIR
ncbi:MAG: beta-galactosidase [Promethearchaeota archaeon]|nr:MAG: beta-galactosidase [Candidatus Lokiarchaeota archaeon]